MLYHKRQYREVFLIPNVNFFHPEDLSDDLRILKKLYGVGGKSDILHLALTDFIQKNKKDIDEFRSKEKRLSELQIEQKMLKPEGKTTEILETEETRGAE